MKEKLDNTLDTKEIKQTRNKRETIPFRDSAISKLSRTNTEFGSKRFKEYKFDVPKGSSLKGLLLRFSKKTESKSIVLGYWFGNRNEYYTIGTYPQIRCKDVEKICLELAETHQDERGIWIKSPNKTRADEKRIVDKPDTTKPKGYTINEVIEAYCGAELPGETTERGFSRDRKDGYRRAKSCRNWFRYMAGYNHRNTLVRFLDDDKGYGYGDFLANKHLRVAKPTSWRDLFRKYPSGKGMEKDRVYYNRRKKQTYTINKSQNYSIYDSDIGKSLIHELTPGDIEEWIRDKSSWEIKIDYIKCFVSLWIFARKRGWLGTNPGECPFDNGQVYVKKEIRKEDPYKKIAIQNPDELDLFWECSEELAPQFPFKAELHQFMILTAMRKAEALKMKKEYINFEKGTLFIPKEISKTGKEDEELPLVPELEICLLNILDYENDPFFSNFYKMRDFPWLFATRKWRADRYFDKKFKMSPDARLGGDENYIPALRKLMREKSGDPNLKYAPKILRKSYITLSQQVHQGRSEITANMSRHASIDTLNKHYNHPNIETARSNASKVSSIFKFIKRRSA
jgi:integrase